MKKILINISLVLFFFITFILHVNLFSNLKIAGVMPNIFIIFVLFIGLYINKTVGFTYGMIFGILLDLFVGTIIYELGIYFIGYFVYKYQIEIVKFIKILLIESIYNASLIIILYPLMQNLGYIIEEEYKGSKILTRYF